MMGRLRRKFAAVAMAAVTVVLLSMVVCINVVNYMNLCERADERLEVLSEGGGAFPDEEVAAAASALAEHVATRRVARPPAYTPEAPFETRYFTVTLSAEGDVLDSNTDKIAAVGAETAVAIARDVCARGGASGFYDVYRYRADDLADGSKMYIFLDCTRELDSFHSFLAVSAGVSALGWTLVFLLVVGFSRLAVRPIVEGYEKQKRFITDASHEIKTPLAVIRAANEVIALEHGGGRVDEEHRRAGGAARRPDGAPRLAGPHGRGRVGAVHGRRIAERGGGGGRDAVPPRRGVAREGDLGFHRRRPERAGRQGRPSPGARAAGR